MLADAAGDPHGTGLRVRGKLPGAADPLRNPREASSDRDRHRCDAPAIFAPVPQRPTHVLHNGADGCGEGVEWFAHEWVFPIRQGNSRIHPGRVKPSHNKFARLLADVFRPKIWFFFLKSLHQCHATRIIGQDHLHPLLSHPVLGAHEGAVLADDHPRNAE